MIRRLLGGLLAVILSISLPAVSYGAARVYSTEVENRIGTGDVRITLEEYELDALGREIPYQDGKRVVPGQRISKIVKVGNRAETAWIRAGVEYADAEGMTDDHLELESGWVRRGAYFYWTQPVQRGEEICLFRNIRIPSEWDESRSEQSFSLTVTAQAIQADNFQPDFQGEDPWFGVPIEACGHGESEGGGEPGNQEFAIVFENGSEGFVRTGEDFFGNFSQLMPGDEVTDSVEIGNRYGRNIGIYFRTEIPDQEEKAKELLEKVELTIRNGGKEIYRGALGAEGLRDGVCLAENLAKGETVDLSYELRMPRELNNAWALREAGVRWIFRAEYDLPSGSSGGGSGDPGGSHETQLEREPGEIQVPAYIPEPVRQMVEGVLPKLGDVSRPGFWLASLGCGIVLLLCACAVRKEKRKESGDGRDGKTS